MEETFDWLDMNFFTRAEVFPGSVGTFRYRFARKGWIGDGEITVWVYENICFEQAKEVESAAFPWTEEGVKALRTWLREELSRRGSEPYRIPYPAGR